MDENQWELNNDPDYTRWLDQLDYANRVADMDAEAYGD